MKQVININFQGSVVPIEQDAYETLKTYLESLRNYFKNEQGADEIMGDIENRIAELFQERLKNGASCITTPDVEAIKKSIGTPADFGEEEAGEQAGAHANGPFQSANNYFGTRKLYRNENDKVLGGVCSGLANYIGVDTVIVRIVFAILFFAFGVGLIPYLLLWIIVPSSATTEIGSVRRRLFRDPDDKYLGGVCSGIANYFSIQSWIVRLLFLLPLVSVAFKWMNWDGFNYNFGFNSTSVIIYIILWILVPEAKSTSEKLEMKGEKVDLNSIKNSRSEDIRQFASRTQQMGREAADAIKNNSQHVVADIQQSFSRNKNGVGYVISTIFKVIGFLILGFILLVVLAALFGLSVGSIGVMPLTGFMLKDGWQTYMAWGTLLFFVLTPLIGIITWIIRKLAKLNKGSVYLRTTFIVLWILGWFCFVSLLASLSKDFKKPANTPDQVVALSDSGLGKLIVTSDETYTRKRNRRLRSISLDANTDTIAINNIIFNIYKSADSNFRVTKSLGARGSSSAEAFQTISKINYNVVQQDSLLKIDDGIAITRDNKFRNQYVVLNIYVPVGKQIKINRPVGILNDFYIDGLSINDNRWVYEADDAEKGWSFGVEYLMTNEGLKTLDGKKTTDDWIWDDGENNNNNKVENLTPGDIRRQIDSLNERKDEIKDSLRKEKDKIESELDKLTADNTAGAEVYPIMGYTPHILMR